MNDTTSTIFSTAAREAKRRRVGSRRLAPDRRTADAAASSSSSSSSASAATVVVDAEELMARPDDAGPPARPDARRATGFAVLGVLLVTAVHVWIISAGWMTNWPHYSGYYDRLADAFLHGQTSLRIRPAPGHLALKDPYDPKANRGYRQRQGVHDAVLFDKKLYLYWGPVPALMLAPVKYALGMHQPGVPLDAEGVGARTIGDEYLVFAFAAGSTLFTALILRRLWGRFFADQPPWTILVGMLVAGLATPMAYLLARSAVYEAAIMGGQFFLLAGIYLALGRQTNKPGSERSAAEGFNPPAQRSGDPDPDAASHGKPNASGASLRSQSDLHCARGFWGRFTGGRGCAAAPYGLFRLALIGTCWALAVGSRVSLAIAVTVLGMLLTWRILRHGWARGRRVDWGRCLALGTPLVAGAVALAAYNHVRFGTWREFGQKYQLTAANYAATPALFSVGNLWPGLYSYGLRPVQGAPQFPFLAARSGDGTFPSFIRIPPHYEYNEPIAGLLLVTPFVWLAAIPVLRWVASFRRRRRVDDLPRADDAGEVNHAVRMLLVGGCLGFAPVLFMLGSTMRYLADLTPCLLIVATVGVWQHGRAVAPFAGRRRVFRAVVGGLAAYSVIVGMLLAITGYYGHFQVHHAEWFDGPYYRTDAPVLSSAR